MKKLLFLSLGASLLFACNNTTEGAEEKTEMAQEEATVDYQYYGDSISDDGAIASSELTTMMAGKDSLQVKLSGTINSSCKMKGCWMKMDMGDGKEMRISFKDYGFFVPKNLNGETAVIEGYAKVDTTSVEELRHFAMDGGMTKEEAEAKYTAPEVNVSYVATGVIIKP